MCTWTLRERFTELKRASPWDNDVFEKNRLPGPIQLLGLEVGADTPFDAINPA